MQTLEHIQNFLKVGQFFAYFVPLNVENLTLVSTIELRT